MVSIAPHVIKNNQCMKEKLDASASVDGSEALASSSIGSRGFKFGGLGLQGQPDEYSVRNF